jgi:translation initiation factor 1
MSGAVCLCAICAGSRRSEEPWYTDPMASTRNRPPSDGGGIVYSTGIGERCPNCLRAVRECVCKKGTPAKPSNDGVVRVSRETQGRKGKGVTVVSGLGLPLAQLESLATELKKKCGSGGAVADGRIEIQGDHRDRLVEELLRRGWKAKRAGG